MNFLFEALTANSEINALGWALIHFFWQAAVIAVMIFGFLKVTSDQSANLRYWVCCFGLLAMVCSPILTYCWLANHSPAPQFDAYTYQDTFDNFEFQPSTDPLRLDPPVLLERPKEFLLNRSAVAPIASASGVAPSAFNRAIALVLPILVCLWLTGAVGRLLLMLGGVWRVRTWMAEAIPLNESHLQKSFDQLCRSMSFRSNVRLAVSERLSSPSVAGILRPIVMIPSSLLTGLSLREMELVLAHELAHIRRHDFVINLLQRASESLLFYHPAVWWISNQISIERENCCDDIAAEICGDRIALARALTTMESMRCAEPKLLPAATGGNLKQRIERLLVHKPRQVQSAWSLGIITFLLTGILAVVVPSTASEVSYGRGQTNVIPAYAWSQNHFIQDSVAAEDPEIPAIKRKPEVERKPEVRRKDSKTGIEQRVFGDIKLTTRSDGKTNEVGLELKYSNVIPYTFIPARIATKLNAVKLGEMDFEKFKGAKRPNDVTWTIYPNDFSNPTGFIQDGVQHYFLDYLNDPVDAPIVPYFEDQFYAPDHLGFYGMNQTGQTKFDVVRIDEVDLGIGKKFGLVRALVLNDENSEFGLLGNRWARMVQGKRGGTLVHSATGEFLIYPKSNQGQKRTKKDNQKSTKSEPKKEENRASNPGNQSSAKRPRYEIIRQNDDIKQIALHSIEVRRTPADLIKHFARTLEMHAGPRPGLSITNMESIVSAVPIKRFDQFVEAENIVFSLPEGSQSRVSISGDKIEVGDDEDYLEFTVTDGKVEWIDSVGVVRAVAQPDGGAEQLIIKAEIGNDEVVLNIKTRRIKPDPSYPLPPVQVRMNVATGAPANEKQPPHGSIRYEIFEADEAGDKPMRMKMKWRYDIDRLAREAEKQTGKPWNVIIWGTDAPKRKLNR